MEQINFCAYWVILTFL